MFGQYPSGRASVVRDRHGWRDVRVEDGITRVIYDGHMPKNERK
jgi:hypothetical protein